jgi:phosphoglycerate kinase
MSARRPAVAQSLQVPTLEDLPDPAGKRVLVRATLDLPLGIAESSPMARRRAEGLRATLCWLTERGAIVTVWGDAGGGDRTEQTDLSARAARIVESLSPGAVIVAGPASGASSAEDPAVVKDLIGSHDLFVNDSFQWAYLPLPSQVLPPSYLPSAGGRTLQGDLDAIVPVLQSPERPFTAVLGGDRSYLRLHGMQGLVLRADTLLVGGAMALPLLQASGRQPFDGVYDDFLVECRGLCGLAERVAHRIQLPVDLVWSRPDGTVEVAPAAEHPGGQVVDIGPITRHRFAEFVEGAGLVLWTGALGQVEDERFAAGTHAVATALGASDCVVGGDALMSMLDTAALLPPGARVVSATDSALELLKNGDLPALIALRSSTQAN